jgi:hypothetical protein
MEGIRRKSGVVGLLVSEEAHRGTSIVGRKLASLQQAQ